MAPRLPVSKQDPWGDDLRDYLLAEHDVFGNLTNVVRPDELVDFRAESDDAYPDRVTTEAAIARVDPGTAGTAGQELVIVNDSPAFNDPPEVLASRHGIVPDGAVVDQTLAVQAFIDTHAGKRIRFDRKGAFRLTQVAIPNDTIVDFGQASIYRDSDPAQPTLNHGALLVNASDPAQNITILGGDFQNAGTTGDRRVMAFWRVNGLTMLHNRVTLQNDVNWITWFLDCENVRIEGYYQDTGPERTKDGLHFSGGKKVTISNCNIRCGDDCIAIAWGADPVSDNLVAEDFAISNCTLESRDGRILALGVDNPNGIIRRVSATNIVGTIGTAPSASGSKAINIHGTTGGYIVSDISLTNITVDCSAAPSSVIGHGLFANYVDGLSLAQVTIVNASAGGVWVEEVKRLTAVDVETRDNRNGRAFALYGTPNAKLVACRSYRPSSTAHAFQLGTATQASNDCVLVACEAESASNSYGISLRNAHQTLIHGCTLTGNNGVFEDAVSDNNTVVYNDLSALTGINKLQLVGAGTVSGHNRGVAAPAYTETNVTNDRTFDADTVTVAELADIVGTLIGDLREQGIVS